jgi:vanillate O-demethylase monooxygenase subunit
MLLHAFTPQTERSCHYFYSVGRDHHLGNAELNAMSVRVIRDTSLQDKEALELIEERFELDGTQPEVSVTSDKAGLQTRRAVARLMTENNPVEEHCEAGISVWPELFQVARGEPLH